MFSLDFTVSFFQLGNFVFRSIRADDGSYRLILSLQKNSARWLCAYGSSIHSGTMSETVLAANNRYTLAPVLADIGNYTLDKAQVGDFYCRNNSKEGYLIPGDIPSLAEAQQAACIGIVYSTDAYRIGAAATDALNTKGVATPHGLVMALTDASDGCRWGDYNTDENSGGSNGQPFYANTDQLKKQYANVDGYGETHWIIDTYKNSGSALQDTYTAFYYADRYGTAADGTEKYAVSSNTTGWFIPSMGQ